MILLIEDEEILRFTFKSFLSKAGHEVITAEDYDVALKVISEIELDLIIADIVLKGHTGLDVLKEVKTKGMRTPVIMITGKPSIETASEAVRLGAYDYLTKPVEKDGLLKVTSQALRYRTILEEKDRIEAEKEKYRSDLETIFASVQEGIVTVDSQMQVMNANNSFERICDPVSRDIIGKRFDEIAHRCNSACSNVLGEVLQTKKEVRAVRVECRHDEHRRQMVVLTSSPLKDRSDNFTGAVLVIRDVTRENDLERELKERRQFQNIIGKSGKMQQVYELLEDLAHSNTTVLVTGESGTGKELVANALHYSANRANNPLVKVNCSALSDSILESELFGHVKGAFTGAVRDKIGRFEMADGGSILLDEIGEISPAIQLKLLRVIQEKEFERVGESKPIKIDIRIIATTNRNLKERVRQNHFREDLYYRLKVVEIPLPPLRDRIGDIPLLVDYFCKQFNRRFNTRIESVSDDVNRTLTAYPWPGNVRELE
ncbi:MAG: sigma 54-interacting transcriptional regulator, partial [Deltaproteobacteria bacterium]|nr:sigma 54-interacting transcriptional regulator [Deltaproteobacteria bacterium]